MLWVDQQYHNAILDRQKQNKLFQIYDWRAPVQHKTFDVIHLIKQKQIQASILQSDLYHLLFIFQFYFELQYTIFVQYLNAICCSKWF